MEVVNWLNPHLCQPPKESNPITRPADNHLDGMNKDTGIRNRKGAPRAVEREIMECRQDQKSTNNSVDDWRHGRLRNPPVVTAVALATKKNKAMASNWMGVNVDRLKFLFRWRAFLEQFTIMKSVRRTISRIPATYMNTIDRYGSESVTCNIWWWTNIMSL